MSQEVQSAENAAAAVEHGAQAAGHGAEHGASGGFPPFDSSLFSHQIFWFIISFAFLYLILAFVILPKITATIADRKNKIENDLKTAQQMSQMAEDARIEADKAQANARNDARAYLENLRKDLDENQSKSKAEAVASSDAMLAEAEAKISTQVSKAISNINDEVSELASQIFEQLAGKKPTAAQIKAASKGAN